MSTINRDQAIIEFDKWAFDIKKIKPRLIDEELKESVVQNIMDGTFAIDEEGNVIQKLLFPTSDTVQELKFKPRLLGFEMSKMKEYKDSDATGKASALIAVLTGMNKGIIGKLDSSDLMAAQQLVSFYLVG